MGVGIQRRLRGFVSSHANGTNGCNRRDIGDDAESLLTHHRQRMFAHQHSSFHVGGKDPIPDLLSNTGCTSVAEPDAYVVVQHIDPAVTLDTSIDDRLAITFAGHIRFTTAAGAATLGNQCQRFLGRSEITIDQQNARTFLCEPNGGSASIAYGVPGRLPGTDNDSNLVF